MMVGFKSSRNEEAKKKLRKDTRSTAEHVKSKHLSGAKAKAFHECLCPSQLGCAAVSSEPLLDGAQLADKPCTFNLPQSESKPT